MDKATVFILDGNFLGLEMARELRDAGYQVVVIGHRKTDIALYAKGIRGHLLPLPQEDPEALLKGVFEIGSGYAAPRVLMGASDGYRRWVSHNQQQLSGLFCLLACPRQEIDALLDKWNQLQMAATKEISFPASAIMDEKGDLTRHIRFPVVVKPRYSQKTIGFRDRLGSKLLVVHSKHQLKAACRKISQMGFSPLAQEMIPGADFSQFLFGAAVRDGKPYAICLAQKLKADPRPFGSGVVIRTIYQDELMEAGLKILEGTHYSGICDIEFMRNWDTGEFQFIEFNPRYGLGQRVAQTAGAGLPEMAVRLALGETPQDIMVAKPGFYWVYFDEWVKERLMPWRNMFLKTLRTRGNTARIFDLQDCHPEVRHLKNIARLKLHRMLTGRSNYCA